ncbi:MAG: STM3941 family protein [Hyphomonadaceae bacterium]
MSRLRAFLLTLLGLAFVAGGVFIMRRDPTNAGLAWGGIAFFGACAFVGALQLLPTRRTIAPDAVELTLQPGRLHTIGMAIGGLAMGAGCFLLAPLASQKGDAFIAIVAYFGAAFFGLGALLIGWRAIRMQPIARLDSDGVHTFGPGAWTLPWRDVSAIGIYTVASQQFLLFESQSRPPPLLSPMGFTISTAGTGFAFDDVLAFANALWARHHRS